MALELTKNSIDLGIITTDADAMLAFYRDTVGLEYVAEMAMPGSTMHRLLCGESLIKIVVHNKAPAASAAPGGLQGATGYRYWTLSVADVAAITQRCSDAGYTVAIPVTEIRAGVTISMVEDPDGNWVEFLQNG